MLPPLLAVYVLLHTKAHSGWLNGYILPFPLDYSCYCYHTAALLCCLRQQLINKQLQFEHLLSSVVTAGITGAVVTAGAVVAAFKQFNHNHQCNDFCL